MKFGAHYLPTYIPELDGPAPEFYRRMFEQMELLDQLGFHQVWVTEHHFHEYGGTIPDPATFLSAVASRTSMYEPEVLRNSIDHYREALVKAGHDPSTREVLGKFHIYVTGSEREAVAEAEPYLHNYWTVSGAQNPVRAAARQIQAEDQIARGNVIAGEPQRCIDLIRRWRDALGRTIVSGAFYFGGMPQEMALRNIRLFAAEVMPAFVEAEAIAP
jgi:alkanesulfonate monooxygenase SsuD/methylene tetrahydromethanopterin reductase-like flavin-dependent oxidoreductase (luciferase family)